MKFTRVAVRRLACQQGYRLAGSAEASRVGSWARVPVWGWSREKGRILLTTFILSAEHPSGYCSLAPVADTVFATGGLKANQLGLDFTTRS